jgi:hypothetical protein
VGGFTIALEIIDPTNEQNRIDLNIEALAATDSLKYIPDEYLISERAYNESQNLHGGSENVLKAIDFDALEADSDYDTYDTLLIPDTFNSISGNLNISSHVNDCFTKIVNLNFVAYESTGISIGNNTFSGCTNFINIDSSGRTIDSIGGSTFADCTSLTTITIPEGSSISIGSEAFRDCTKLNGFKGNADSITLSSIGSAAFSGCTSLTFDDLNTIVSTASIKKITNESSGIAFRSSDGLTIQGCLIAGDFDLSDAE